LYATSFFSIKLQIQFIYQPCHYYHCVGVTLTYACVTKSQSPTKNQLKFDRYYHTPFASAE